MRDVLLGLRAGADQPVSKYKIELEEHFAKKRIERERKLHSLEFKANQSEKATKRQRQRNLDRINAVREHSEAVLEKQKKELDSKHSLLSVARRERERAEKRFDEWQEALGRPPFWSAHRSLIDRMRFKFEPQTGEGNGLSAMTSTIDTEAFGSVGRRFMAIVSGVLGFLVIPFDIYYSLPGFEMILEDRRYAGVAALLLGIILAAVGSTSALLLTLMTTRRLKDGVITTKFHSTYLVLFVLSMFIGLCVVYGGTTVRSIVPEVNSLEVEKQTIGTLISQIEQGGFANQSLEQRTAELERLNLEDDRLEAEISELKTVQFPRLTADALIAFCFYSFAILSILVSRIAGRDPVFEYELATRAWVSSVHNEIRLNNAISRGTSQADAIIASLKLNAQEAAAELEDEAGPSELTEAAVKEQKFVNEAEEAEEVERIKREALRYTKSFRFLTRNRAVIDEWTAIFEDDK